jgi:hypothetical protein
MDCEGIGIYIMLEIIVLRVRALWDEEYYTLYIYFYVWC